MSQPFTLGVNYWPRRKAMYWWSDFDAGEVREEFSIIKEIGMNVVRLFLLWDDFQPEPDSVNKEALANLVKVADIASENGLGLDVTFFTGHMSGPNWSPRWLLGGDLPPTAHSNWLRDVVSEGKKTDKGYRNMFHDEMALNATRLLLKTVVSALKDHPAIWMWNLGNEPDLFAWPNSSDEGAAWVKEMVELIKSIDPNHPVTIGLHGDGLHRDNGLRIDKVYKQTDVAVMHSYPMYTPWARQPLDPDFVPFTCALTAALSGKPVLMEEFGGCTALPGEKTYTMKWTETNGRERDQFMASEEDFSEFLRLTIPKLQDSGATGAMLWCYADYIPELWDLPPCQNSQHERFFGLVRPDGSLKPHAKVIQEFAKTNPQVKPIPDYAKITVDPDEFYKEPLGHLVDLYQNYLKGVEASKRLIINSDDYGRTPDISRGIRESHLRGVVTSTTCMMNIPTTPADIAIALRETPKLGLGVHLVLTAERPLLSRERLKTITNEDGSFQKLATLISRINQIDVGEVKEEWHAQVELFVQSAGRKPTHLDSHHHSSYFSPALFRAMLELAKEYGCAIRLPVVYGSDEMAGLPSELIGPIRQYAPTLLTEFNPRRPNAFFASFYDELATREELMKIFAEIKDGTFEIMCHPGYVDDAFAKESSYNKQRETELEILTDPAIRQTIQAQNIELITFAEL